MLKLFEGFDHIGMSTDGSAGNQTSYLWSLGWKFGHGYSPTSPWPWGNPQVVAGRGRFGTRALDCRNATAIFLPTLPRLCNKLVVGLCVADCITSQWQLGRQNYGEGIPDIWFYFMYDPGDGTAFIVNFKVRIRFSRDYKATVTCFTGNDNDDSYAYPIILTPEHIPAPYFTSDFNFLEASVDLTDFMNGSFKFAYNGVTYIDKTGLVTANYSVFGSDPFDPRAKINKVVVTFMSGAALVDTIYLCDDAGGYQNDLLGPLLSVTRYPIEDGDRSNWMPVDNSVVVDAPGAHHEFVDDDPIYPGNETTYLQADQDLSSELMFYGLDPIPAGGSLVAVNSRTLFRNVASVGTPQFNSIVPLFQMQGNPTIETNSLAKRADGWTYTFLDVYYPLVPGFATPWAEYLLKQSTFGFMLRTLENMQMQLEEVSIADFSDTLYDWYELIDESIAIQEDVGDDAANKVVWDVTIDDTFGIDEEPDYGWFFLEDEIGYGDALSGLSGGYMDILGAGTISCSSPGVVAAAADAFDGDVDTGWASLSQSPSLTWIQSDIPTARSVDPPPTAYSILSNYLTNVGDGHPNSWRVEGKLTGGQWITLDEQLDHEYTDEKMVFPLTDPVRYQSYRLAITVTQQPFVVIKEFQAWVHWIEGETIE